MRKLGILVAALAVLRLTAPVFAHHGFDTEYDAKKHVKLTGVVTMVSWTNPHMRVYIDVTGPDGKVTNWNMEPEYDPPPGLGSRRSQDRRQGDLRRVRRQGRREPRLAADDHEGQRHEAAVRAGRT